MANGVGKTDSNEKSKLEKSVEKKDKRKSKEQKQSVLESHGYSVGRSVGSGSYATVKVITIVYSIIILISPVEPYT